MPEEYFPKTIWAQVKDAGHERTVIRAPALEALLQRYIPAIRAHLIRTKGIKPDQADDLIQGFILSRVLEKNLVARADQTKGKFRTYLLTALDRYIYNEYRHATAKKRSGGPLADLDAVAEPQQPGESGSDVFEVEWARGLLGATLDAMEAQCRATGREDLWNVFDCRLLGPMLRQEEPVSYEVLVERFGLVSPSQASNILISAKRMFTRLLREQIAAYAEDDEQIAQEIRDLMNILAQARD